MTVVVDYGIGNVGSIVNMLKKIGMPAILASTPEAIASATKLILPGVGTFDNGMRNLRERGLMTALNAKVLEERTPLLGICLGAQLITNRSEEGMLPGLQWINARTVRFNFNGRMPKPKVPHMGWNTVRLLKPSALYDGLPAESRFYFVHSYHIICEDPEDRLTETTHGFPFTSSVQHGNVLGAQFHPEKSHRFGMQLLKNFVERF
jgi:glutamine amidotransferase